MMTYLLSGTAHLAPATTFRYTFKAASMSRCLPYEDELQRLRSGLGNFDESETLECRCYVSVF